MALWRRRHIEDAGSPELDPLLPDGRTSRYADVDREDNKILPKVVDARQNGVPLITGFDPLLRMSQPGPLVAKWGMGNWSGSEDKELRTMRAGLRSRS